MVPMRKFGSWPCLVEPGCCQRLQWVLESWRKRSLTPTQTWRTSSQTWRIGHCHLQVQTFQTVARRHCHPPGCHLDTRVVSSPPDGSSSAPCTRTLATSYLQRMGMRMMMRTKEGKMRKTRTNIKGVGGSSLDL